LGISTKLGFQPLQKVFVILVGGLFLLAAPAFSDDFDATEFAQDLRVDEQLRHLFQMILGDPGTYRQMSTMAFEARRT
jgi:hypothetical protein